MRNLMKDFENKNIDYQKLLEYGFLQKGDCYFYENEIIENRFKVIIEISKEKQVAKVIDLASNEEYIPVDIKNSLGTFVGKVKEEYEGILNNMIEQCTTQNIFKSEQAKKVIEYVKEKYKDDLEYLWKKFSNNAVWRNKENKKWYGVLLVLSENKLGIQSNKIIDVLDLRYQKNTIMNIIDNCKIFAGYHMNKNNWISIKLDGSLPIEEICRLIDNSYEIILSK